MLDVSNESIGLPTHQTMIYPEHLLKLSEGSERRAMLIAFSDKVIVIARLSLTKISVQFHWSYLLTSPVP